MAASVLYFGPDEWNRVQVFESAGYAVQQCLKISDLESELKKSLPAVVVMNSFAHVSFKPALELVHAQAASARIIAFPSPGESGFEKSVDLVVPPLTPPEVWLEDLAALLQRTRAVMEQAISVHERSQTLLLQLSDVRERAAATRENSAAARAKSAAARQKVLILGANAGTGIDPENGQSEHANHRRRVAGSTSPRLEEGS